VTRDPHEHLKDLSRAVPNELIQFGRAVNDAGLCVDGWPYFLERSEKWAGEYTLWVNAGRPSEGDGEAWERFCVGAESLA
jgi:hypothetical protein